jgi:nitrogen-specific signal transduction histidine kinase
MESARRKKEARCEISLKSKAGAAIPFEINCRYVVYLGKPCFLCVARETTQTRLLQDQIIRSARLAATGQLAASIAHEINSPLQGISALLNVMRSPTARQYLNASYRPGQRLQQHPGHGQEPSISPPGKEKKQLTDVNQVVENTVALVRSLLLKNMITAELELVARSSTLIASPQQLGQVLMNLLNNSVEAITGVPEYFEHAQLSSEARGRIAVRTFNRDNEFVVELKDSGPGIPDADLNRIFDPFFTSKKPMGMGVGLAICHGVIEDHHGRITAANAPEGGACSPSRCRCSRSKVTGDQTSRQRSRRPRRGLQSAAALHRVGIRPGSLHPPASAVTARGLNRNRVRVCTLCGGRPGRGVTPMQFSSPHRRRLSQSSSASAATAGASKQVPGAAAGAATATGGGTSRIRGMKFAASPAGGRPDRSRRCNFHHCTAGGYPTPRPVWLHPPAGRLHIRFHHHTLRAPRPNISRASGPDALRLQPPRLVKCPGSRRA